jgi:hypothetical protein
MTELVPRNAGKSGKKSQDSRPPAETRPRNFPDFTRFYSFLFFFFVGWDLRHQVLRPLLAYCTAPDDR